MGKLEPIPAENPADVASHDAWFRAQVEAALTSNEPDVPHQTVMEEIEAVIDTHRAAQARLGG